MPYAYVTQSGSQIKKASKTIMIYKDDQLLAEWELHRLDGLLIFGYADITTPALRALLNAGVETAFLDSHGRLKGQLTPPKHGNINIRMAQYKLATDEPHKLILAKSVVTGKLTSMMKMLNRQLSNYPELDVKNEREKITDILSLIKSASTDESLLGFEGAASAAYWAAFRKLNRSELAFNGRSAHPPLDEVNALLSLGYVFLTNEISSTLDAMGFDPYIGFYHGIRQNRVSLALDMIEPFRHSLVDRFVLRAINLSRFTYANFEDRQQRTFRLNRSGFKIFISEYERMQHKEVEDKDGWKGTFRQLIRRRCRLLAEALNQSRGIHLIAQILNPIEDESNE